MLALDNVTIITTSLQGVFLGFATFMTMLTVFMLVRDPRRRRVNHWMIIASCTLLCLATGEFIIDVARLVRGFITVGPHQVGGPWLFFYGVDDYTFIIKGCLYPVQTLILDGVVIYRAYVAWQKLLAISIPVVGWLALLASTIGLMHSMITIPQYPQSEYITRTPPWINALYGCTLFTNFSATAILAYRIWRVNNRASEFQRAYSRLRILLWVVVESGAIYTILNIALLVAFHLNSPLLWYLRDIMAPTVSIVFNMIVVRVGFATNSRIAGIGASTPPPPTAPDVPWKSDWVPEDDPVDAGTGVKSLVHELTEVLEPAADGVSGSARRVRRVEEFPMDATTSRTTLPNV